MGFILNIETTTKICSISLAKNGQPFLVVEENAEYYSHAEKIHYFLSTAIEASLLKVSELNAISISKGPGFYTGLKIGLSVAKGLCYSLGIPLLAIDTLSILIEEISIEKGIIIPMIDASFKEVYASIYNENKTRIAPVQRIIIKNNSFQEYKQHKIYLLGNVAKKAKNIIKTQVYFYKELYPSSDKMAFISEKNYKKKLFENMDTFEPLYGLN